MELIRRGDHASGNQFCPRVMTIHAFYGTCLVEFNLQGIDIPIGVKVVSGRKLQKGRLSGTDASHVFVSKMARFRCISNSKLEAFHESALQSRGMA